MYNKYIIKFIIKMQNIYNFICWKCNVKCKRARQDIQNIWIYTNLKPTFGGIGKSSKFYLKSSKFIERFKQ